MCPRCSYEECIASGSVPRCSCVCHPAYDLDRMHQAVIARRNERCEACRFAAVECGAGRCYCQCHGDRPVRRSRTYVVAPGHDVQGHERSLARHDKISTPATVDADILLALRDQYAEAQRDGVHVENTVGGAQW